MELTPFFSPILDNVGCVHPQSNETEQRGVEREPGFRDGSRSRCNDQHLIAHRQRRRWLRQPPLTFTSEHPMSRLQVLRFPSSTFGRSRTPCRDHTASHLRCRGENRRHLPGANTRAGHGRARTTKTGRRSGER